MQYIHFEPGCGPEALTLRHTASPPLLPGQVRVAVKAFGLNRADTLQRQGKYPPPAGESSILGLEVVGVIVARAQDVDQWSLGQRVMGLVAGGGYATEVSVNAQHLMAVPETLSDAEAAGLVEVFLTAYQALRTIGEVRAGAPVLIHAGASGVGLAAIQLCQLWGVPCAVTVSSEEKATTCRTYGAQLVINYREQDFAQVLKTHWPQGVQLVIDVVGGDYLNRNLSVLAQDGVIVSLAMLAGRFADKLDMALLLAKRARVQGSTLRNRNDAYKASLIAAFAHDCLPAFASGQLRVPVDSVLTPEQVGEGHARLEENRTQGKLVVCWPIEA